MVSGFGKYCSDALHPRTLGARALIGMMLCAMGMGFAHAAELQVDVDDGRRGLGDTVVSLHSSKAKDALRPHPARMDQRGSQFVPRLLTVQAGSPVVFPNKDKIRHHVYSFSPAKRFELPLYGGEMARPVQFDTPGVVTLGCNIHDWMLGYIVVLDTPFSAVTNTQGTATLQAPPGDYTLQVWHPRLPPGTLPQRTPVTLAATGGSKRIRLVLAPMAPLAPADAKLRVLQDKLRNLKRDR